MGIAEVCRDADIIELGVGIKLGSIVLGNGSFAVFGHGFEPSDKLAGNGFCVFAIEFLQEEFCKQSVAGFSFAGDQDGSP